MRNTQEVRPTLHLVSNIEFEVSEDTLVANSVHVQAYDRLIEVQRQKKALEVLEKREKEFLIAELGKKERLVGQDGIELVTYKRDADAIKIDKKAIELKYPEVYADTDCVWAEKGAMRFLVKK